VIRDWNQQAEHTFGWSREEVIGRPLDETIIPASMREAHRAGLACYLATGKHHVLNQHIELTAVRRDGMTLPVEVRIALYLLMGKQFLVRSCMISPSEKGRGNPRIRSHSRRANWIV
jgi:PAS domain S-box-containing protein